MTLSPLYTLMIAVGSFMSFSANSVADVNQDTNQDIFHEHSYSSPVGFVLTFSVVAEKNKLIKFSKCINY